MMFYLFGYVYVVAGRIFCIRFTSCFTPIEDPTRCSLLWFCMRSSLYFLYLKHHSVQYVPPHSPPPLPPVMVYLPYTPQPDVHKVCVCDASACRRPAQSGASSCGQVSEVRSGIYQLLHCCKSTVSPSSQRCAASLSARALL